MNGRCAVCAAMIACMVVSLFGGCGHRASSFVSEADSFEADSALNDSILASEDTFVLDKETLPEPTEVHVDELFDDFIYKFDNSARLQRSRVLFPLTITSAAGESQSIERKKWRHHSLFLGEDFCTILWNSRSQMELAKDTGVNRACIEQIHLQSRTINTYEFERDSLSGQWMLSSIAEVPFESNPQYKFFDFYRQFSTDSVYQRLHVRDPLKFTTIDEDEEYEAVTGTIDSDQWFEFAPELPQDVLTNVNYGQAYPNPNRMVLQMRGLSNGLQTIMIFHRDISGNWQLTDYEN